MALARLPEPGFSEHPVITRLETARFNIAMKPLARLAMHKLGDSETLHIGDLTLIQDETGYDITSEPKVSGSNTWSKVTLSVNKPLPSAYAANYGARIDSWNDISGRQIFTYPSPDSRTEVFRFIRVAKQTLRSA